MTTATRKLLDPKLDIVFWMLFGAAQNRALLISLLTAVLRPTTPIKSVKVLPARPDALGVDDKQIALDLRVTLASGEQIDVEMQSRRHPALRERGLYYWSRMYSGQLRRGSSYTDLRRCVVIFITDFIELAGPHFHSVFRVHESTTHEPLTDGLELHFVELPKLPASVTENGEPSLAAWCTFLRATADEEIAALAATSPIMKEAKTALEWLSADDEARIRAEQRENAMFMHDLGLTRAEQNGERKGEVKILTRQLTTKLGPLPLDVEKRLSQATATELERWAERVLVATTWDDIFRE